MDKAQGWHFKWRLPACGGIAGLVVALPTLIWGHDAAAFFLSFPLALLVVVFLLALAFTALKQRTLGAALMICIFLAVAYPLLQYSGWLRTTTRWLIGSPTYKELLLHQPKSSDGPLRHMEWDAWGFPGAGDTTEYLVNDPGDRLETAIGSDSQWKAVGLPCKVAEIHRLESQWYTVRFYTDTDWEHCP